jgi:signal transduction histidine kinase
MKTSTSRDEAVQAIESAIDHLAHALSELERMPAGDASAIGVVGHVVSNYLSVSDATLDLLAGALRDHPNAEVNGWLTGLRHLGEMMHHAVGRLAQTSTAAELPLRFEDVNLARLIARACDYYRPMADRKAVEIVCRASGEIPAAAGDRVAVAVVADNLLSNAVKFSPGGTRILVEMLPGPGGVVCNVRDQGPGLSRAEQSWLFQKGVRPGAGAPSHGYGLSIAKELIDRMHGRVWYETDPATGSCFSFRLPYASARSDSVE